jgi:hypothetical protein
MINKLPILKATFPWPEHPPDVPKDMTGWFHKGKQALLSEVVPQDSKIVVELGSWLGQSTRWWLKHCPKATVIAVDTWLGSCEHIRKKAHILPVLYETFVVNNWEFRDRLIPFRNTSLAALNFVHHLGIKPDVVYFDSDHSYWGLRAELETAGELFPEAIFVGDDFEEGNPVDKAVVEFAGIETGDIVNSKGWKDVRTLNFSWYIDKGMQNEM